VIPKAELLATASELGLLPSTVEKDYVLGWALMAIAEHEPLSQWYFKGGTCLKKCYFDTYRFSEDLDFTIPGDSPYDKDSIRNSLIEIANTVREWTGVDFPTDGVDVRESENKRGMPTFEARMTFV